MTEPGPTDRAGGDPAATIADVFHQRNIPFTRQRRLVWEYFAGSDRAASVPEAAEALRPSGVGQATVYRTVTLLTDLGLLVRVQDRRGEIGFTAPPLGHSHPLVCGVCRRVVRFDGDGDLTAFEERLAADSGFTIYGHHLEVYGICPACRAGRDSAQETPR